MNDSVGLLADRWHRLWNGDYALLESIVAEDVVVHAAMVGNADGEGLRGRAALGNWICTMRQTIPTLAFRVEVGPIGDPPYLVLRWRAFGRVGGADEATRAIDFTGTDILRTADGRIAEYWVNSDTHLLMQALAPEPLPTDPAGPHGPAGSREKTHDDRHGPGPHGRRPRRSVRTASAGYAPHSTMMTSVRREVAPNALISGPGRVLPVDVI